MLTVFPFLAHIWLPLAGQELSHAHCPPIGTSGNTDCQGYLQIHNYLYQKENYLLDLRLKELTLEPLSSKTQKFHKYACLQQKNLLNRGQIQYRKEQIFNLIFLRVLAFLCRLLQIYTLLHRTRLQLFLEQSRYVNETLHQLFLEQSR